MDILDACVVHTAAAARFGVQGAFKHRAENRGADFRPVEILAGFVQQQIADFIGKGRYLYIFITEQAAVDIGERGQLRVIVLQIGVTVLQLGVQYAEQLHQRLAHTARVERGQIVVEHTVPPKNPCVLGVQAEHQPHTQLVQTFQRLLGLRVGILLVKRVIQEPYNFTGGNGNLHLALEVFAAGVHQKLQTIVFFFKVCQRNDFRLATGALHIVDIELRKVAGHDPTRVLGKRQFCNVAFGLLERRQHSAV